MWVNPCLVMGCNTLHPCCGGWWGIEHMDRGMCEVTWFFDLVEVVLLLQWGALRLVSGVSVRSLKRTGVTVTVLLCHCKMLQQNPQQQAVLSSVLYAVLF